MDRSVRTRWIAPVVAVMAGACGGDSDPAAVAVGALFGTVTGIGCSDGLAAAAVVATDGSGASFSAVSDASGSYRIDGLAAGTYTASAEASAPFVLTTGPGMSVGNGDTRHDIDVEYEFPATRDGSTAWHGPDDPIVEPEITFTGLGGQFPSVVFLDFDLSPAPPGCVVQEAELRLRLRGGSFAALQADVDVFELPASVVWTENVNSIDVFDCRTARPCQVSDFLENETPLESTTIPNTGPFTFRELAGTQAFASLLAGANGIALASEPETLLYMEISDRDDGVAPDPGVAPRLRVVR